MAEVPAATEVSAFPGGGNSAGLRTAANTWRAVIMLEGRRLAHNIGNNAGRSLVSSAEVPSAAQTRAAPTPGAVSAGRVGSTTAGGMEGGERDEEGDGRRHWGSWAPEAGGVDADVTRRAYGATGKRVCLDVSPTTGGDVLGGSGSGGEGGAAGRAGVEGPAMVVAR